MTPLLLNPFQLEPLTRSDTSHALAVMEDLLNYLYDLDYKASRMKHAQRSAVVVPPSQPGPKQR